MSQDIQEITREEFKRGMLVSLKMISGWCAIAENFDELKLMLKVAILSCEIEADPTNTTQV